jgi:hypothetical protein
MFGLFKKKSAATEKAELAHKASVTLIQNQLDFAGLRAASVQSRTLSVYRDRQL